MNNPALANHQCEVMVGTVHPEDRALREATRAPRWTRIPQAWVVSATQAGLLRDRSQSEKSQGFGDRVPELFPNQTTTETRGNSA